MKTNKVLCIIALSLSAMALAGCEAPDNKEDIVILYTTDAHCALEDNVGYAHFAGYRDHMKEVHDHVFTLDAGDFLQGDLAGALSKGSYVIDVMNEVGYDAITLGNHEFDYGMEVLSDRLSELDADALSCNISYKGNNNNPLEKIQPYTILDAGNNKIGVVGVTTPYSITSAGPNHFKEDGQTVFDFASSSKEVFYSTVQNSIDNCKKEGANHVVLLTHLGRGESFGIFSSDELAKNTYGASAILDGHLHDTFIKTDIRNKNDEIVPLCGAGHDLEVFGKICIRPDGSVNIENIKNKSYKSEKVQAKIDQINKKMETVTSVPAGTSDIALSIKKWDGTRIVRNREAPIGNFIADAFQYFGQTDCAICNGGMIRDNLPKGNITVGDIIRIVPFGNQLCRIKATGQEILDFLEFAAKDVSSLTGLFGFAFGESGGFAHVSGLTYAVNTDVPTPVKLDNAGNLIKIEGKRRVLDVYIRSEGNLEVLDPAKTYTVCSTDFSLLNGGDGNTAFANAEVIETEECLDYQAVIDYLQYLNGNLTEKYASTDYRITII